MYPSWIAFQSKETSKHAMSQTKSAKGSYKDEQTDRLLREMLG